MLLKTLKHKTRVLELLLQGQIVNTYVIESDSIELK
jgi:hypothetical protein